MPKYTITEAVAELLFRTTKTESGEPDLWKVLLAIRPPNNPKLREYTSGRILGALGVRDDIGLIVRRDYLTKKEKTERDRMLMDAGLYYRLSFFYALQTLKKLGFNVADREDTL